MIRSEGNLANNSLWMVLSRFGAQGLTVVFTVVLARRLGSAGFGEYAFLAALIYVANSLTTFGTDMLLIREIAARDDLSGLPAALALQLLISGLLIAAIWLFGARIPGQGAETVLALRIYVLSLIPLAFFTVFSTALRGERRMEAYALLGLIVPALQAGIVLIPRLSLVALCVLLLAVQIVAAIAAGWMCAAVIPHLSQVWSTSRRRLYGLMKACAPLALLSVLGMAYQRLSIYMLSTMTTPTDTGLFSAAARTVEASKTIHLAVFAALYPVMALARNRGAHPKQVTESVRVSRNALLAGAAAGVVLLFVFARPIILLLYGSQYTSSIPVLRVLAWMLIPFTVNTYLTLSFVASNREWVVARALAISLVGLLILSLWQIPAWGPVGGAWAALAAEGLQSVVLLVSAQARSTAEGAAHELSNLPG